MSVFSSYTGPSDRQRLAALGDVDAREREAVATAIARRAATTAETDDDTVWVSTEDLERVEDHGSVIIFTGHDDQGRVVRFGVDHRAATGLVEVVQVEDVVPCHVEGWQVLSRTSAALV